MTELQGKYNNMELYVEIFFARVVESAILYLKQVIEIKDGDDNPDKLVRQAYVQKFPEQSDNPGTLLIHSTSWRYEEPGNLIITYIVFSEELNLADSDVGRLPLNAVNLARSENPEIPKPAIIKEINVVSHGFRHLSFLAKNDPVVRNRLSSNPLTLAMVEKLPMGLAGAI
jgi:hypothetical protein